MILLSFQSLIKIEICCNFSCPNNWIDSKNGCFFFATEEESMNWYDALEYCKGLDAYLAEVHDNETQILLETQAALLPPTNWWLGATDEENVSKDK